MLRRLGKSFSSARSVNKASYSTLEALSSLETPKVSVLSNGLKVVTQHMPDSEVSTLGMWINAGSRYETPEEDGVAHYLEHLLFKGTKSSSRVQFEKRVEDSGIHINAYTTREQIGYFAQATNGLQKQALGEIADILQNAKLLEESVKNEKNVILSEMKHIENIHEEVILDFLHRTAFRGCSLGHEILGSKENIMNMTSDRLKNYMKKHYTTNRMVLVGAGNLDHATVEKWGEELFTDLNEAKEEVSIPPVSFIGSDYRHRMDSLGKACIGYAFPVPGMDDDRCWTLMVIERMLGKLEPNTPFQEHSLCNLTRAVVEDDCAQRYFSFYHPYSDIGFLGVYAEANPYQLYRLGQNIPNEITRLCFEVDEGNFDIAKKSLIREYLGQRMMSMNVADDLGRLTLQRGAPVDPYAVAKHIDNVTPEMVHKVANEFFFDQDFVFAGYGALWEMPDYNYMRGFTSSMKLV